jgi:hypothetical protein
MLAGRAAAPGERCGPCGDGTTICAASDLLACIGGSSSESCRDAETDGGPGDAPAADATDSGSTRDARDAMAPDGPHNDCGGQGPLLFRGVNAFPGQICGVCNEGVLVCESPTSLGCSGESKADVCGGDVAVLNACGGMGPLTWRGAPTTLNAKCGPCSSQFRCASKTTLVCATSDCPDAGGDTCTIPKSAYTATAPTPPAPPAETAPTAPSATPVMLSANWLLYNPFDFRLYASVGSQQGTSGNSIAVIDPYTATVVKTIFVGSEPRKMAMSDDGKFLWVALDGTGMIRQVDLVSATAGQQFSAGSDSSFGSWFADSLAVLPGTHGSVVVTRYSKGSTATDGPIVYDDGVPRAYSGGSGFYAIIDLIPTYSPSLMFGYDSKSSGFELTTSCVDANGLIVKQITKPFDGYGTTFSFAQNVIYSSGGVAYDVASGNTLGTYAGKGPVVAEASTRRVYFLTAPLFSTSASVAAYDMDSFLSKGSETLVPSIASGSSVANFVRWGRYGFAFRVGSAAVVIAKSTLVAQGP